MLGVPAVPRKGPPAAAANNMDVQVLMRVPALRHEYCIIRTESIQRRSTYDWEYHIR